MVQLNNTVLSLRSKKIRKKIEYRFGGGCHTFYFVFFNTCNPNHIHTMLPYIHPSPITEHYLIALVLSGEKPPCGAEPRIELGPAFQQADALPT